MFQVQQMITIDRTALFRVTGACYMWQFTIFDADPNGTAYLDYTANHLFLTFHITN